MIDSSERPNIRDLMIPDTEKEQVGLFDPAKEVTEEIWAGLVASITDDRKRGVLFKLDETAADMKIISPERFAHVDLGADIFPKLNSRTDDAALATNVMLRANLRFLFPDLFDVGREIIGTVKRNYLSVLDNSPRRAKWKEFFNLGAYVKMLYPDEDMSEIVTPRRLKKAQEVLEKLIESDEENHWKGFAKHAAQAKIFLSDHALDIQVPAKVWKELRAELDSSAVNPGAEYAQLARNMAILAAKKVTVTQEGIELTMPQPTPSIETRDVPPPTPRKF